MIISTHRIDTGRASPRRSGGARPAGTRAKAFTLVEVMISASIGSFILMAVLTAFLMIGRSGVNLSSYATMESQARRALEQFGMDVRMAKGISWSSTSSITLTIPGVLSSDPDTTITYYYDNATTGDTAQSFCRKTGDASSTATPTVLVSGVTTFSFARYKIAALGTATNDLETKQLQLTLTATRTNITVVTASNTVLSARYIMRNKVAST